MPGNPLQRIRHAICQWRRRPRSTETKFAMLTDVTKDALLLAFPLYLTPSEYNKNPRIQRTLILIALGVAATKFSKFCVLFFYKASGFDLPTMVPGFIAGIPGATFFNWAMWISITLTLLVSPLVNWGGDHTARIVQNWCRWEVVRPAPFGFYILHALGAWTWLALGIGVMGMIAFTAQHPIWALDPHSSLAAGLVLVGAVAMMLISFRRQTIRERTAVEIYGSIKAARRATLLFQFLPTVAVAALSLLALKVVGG